LTADSRCPYMLINIPSKRRPASHNTRYSAYSLGDEECGQKPFFQKQVSQ